MRRGSSAPKLNIDVIITCIVEALVGCSELPMFSIGMWAVFALIVRNWAACPPLQLSMPHALFAVLANTMDKPVLDGGRPSSHKMCLDLMTPPGLLGGCLSRPISRS